MTSAAASTAAGTAPAAPQLSLAKQPSRRLAPLDQMRGLVMVLMAVDHSSDAFNSGRLFTDATFLYQPGTPLPTAQFLTRWITHLCAPTFIFLAGTGLALNIDKRKKAGEPAASIDRYLLLRGLIIAAFEIWISLFVVPKGKWLLQVLYAIGACFVLMIPMRRLSAAGAALVAIAIAVLGEVAVVHAGASLPAAMLLTGGFRAHLLIGYPCLHWLCPMLLGWAWGLRLAGQGAAAKPARELALAGVLALASFAVVRGINGYGNMGLLRGGATLVDWLHVSKYPPGISYLTLELGVMALFLSAFFQFSSARSGSARGPLMLLGQTPMFFYVLHFPILVTTAKALGVEHQLGLGATYLGAALVVLALYPACLWYRKYKVAHPRGWPRYL